ncbi:MAG: murein hydrolase activator EnvC family protein, partial [bacterium]
LAAALMLGVAVPLFGEPAGAVPTREQLEELKSELASLDAQRAEVREELEALDTALSGTLAEKEELDRKITISSLKIQNLSDLIETYEGLILRKVSEVNSLLQREKTQWELYKIRVRAMEQNGAGGYFAILFGAESFSDLLFRLDAVRAVAAYDEAVYADLLTIEAETRAAQAELEEYQLGLELSKQDEEETRAELNEDLHRAEEIIAQLESDVEEREGFLAALDADRQNVYQEVLATQEAIRKAEEEERRRLEALRKAEEERKRAEEAKRRAEELARLAAQRVTGTGSFGWPAASSGRITDTFRIRTDHPVYHDERPHEGLDIGGLGYGAKILASDSGNVITSAYSSSYGNYVVIDHNNGYCTLYAHMQSRSVSEGDKVTKGQVIGYVGSTGASTGPHIHFEIWKDGVKVDPAKYFTNLPY